MHSITRNVFAALVALVLACDENGGGEADVECFDLRDDEDYSLAVEAASHCVQRSCPALDFQVPEYLYGCVSGCIDDTPCESASDAIRSQLFSDVVADVCAVLPGEPMACVDH